MAENIDQVLCSELLGFELRDEQGARARLQELVVDLDGEGYPPVDELVFQRGRKRLSLAWEAVQSLDREARQLHVRDLEEAQPFGPEQAAGRTLLRRDVMEAMIVMVPERIVTLASDLWLSREGAALLLRGVEVGVWPLIRRLTRGMLGRGHASWVDWIDVEFLRGTPQQRCRAAGYRSPVLRLQPAEIARLIEALPYLHGAELITLLPHAVAADVLEVTSPERQLQVIEELEHEHAAGLLALMSPDTAADLASRLEAELVHHYLQHMPPERRARLLELLRYPGDTAGGIMVNDMVVLPGQLQVAEARRLLKERIREPDFIYYVYIVEDETSRTLRGVVTMRDLLLGDDGQLVDEIMEAQLTTLTPEEPAISAARRVAESSLAALPVVDEQGRLVGAVTADAAVGQLAPPAWRMQAPRIFS